MRVGAADAGCDLVAVAALARAGSASPGESLAR